MYTQLPNGQIVYYENYSCIVEPQNGIGGIYIGNLESAENIKTLRKNGIKAILTSVKGIQLPHSRANIPFYLQIPGEDRQDFDMSRYFPQAVNFIRSSLCSTNIMVHCLAGVSRSVCLVIAYFIKCKGMTYDEAYSLIKSKRNMIHPNPGFVAQLRNYQETIKKQTKKFVIQADDYSFCENRFIDRQKSQNQNFYEQKSYQYLNKGQKFINNVTRNIEKSQNLLVGKIIPRTKNSFDIPQYQKQLLKFYGGSKDLVNVPAKKIKSLATYKEEKGRQSTNTPEKTIKNNTTFTTPQTKNKAVQNSYSEKRDKGQYDKLRHISANDLQKQLQSKMSQLREKYAKFDILGSNSASKKGEQAKNHQQISVGKFSFLDENQVMNPQQIQAQKYQPIDQKVFEKNIFKNILQRNCRIHSRNIFKNSGFQM